jgi:hypothetical protein
MRVLLIHNFYGSENPSGENVAFVAERELLERRGIEVVLFERRSDSIRSRGAAGLIVGGLSTPFNTRSASLVRELAQKTKPDVVHVHNTFPLISPSIFWSVRDLPCAVVLTLHNYRLFCAAGMARFAHSVWTSAVSSLRCDTDAIEGAGWQQFPWRFQSHCTVGSEHGTSMLIGSSHSQSISAK